MTRMHMNSPLLPALVLIAAAPSLGQADQNAAQLQENRLITVLKSDASRKEKADACRLLARVGTRECVPVLAGMLGDESLSHMARYALEPIPDALADESLRHALGKLQGRPLVGVIGSIGVRRDVKAVDALAGLLANNDPDVAQAAARTLGSIGSASAAKALQSGLAHGPVGRQLAICEGLFRCAERLAAEDQRDGAVAIHDLLLSMNNTAHQVRTGAVRGAILAHQKDGLPLLKEYLRNSDYVLFAAACRTSLEMPGTEVTQILASALGQLPAENQILVIQTLGRRADPAAVPALSITAKGGVKKVRLAAIRSLAEVGHVSAALLLEGLATDSDPELSQAAKESLASLQDPQTQPAP